MKKIIVFLVITFIVISFTMATGCIKTDTNPKEHNTAQDKLDATWDIINNSKEPYSIYDLELTGTDFEHLSSENYFAVIHDMYNYYYIIFRLYDTKITNVENGFHVLTYDADVFFINNGTSKENHYYKVYEILESTNVIYREKVFGNIILLNSEDYQKVVSIFKQAF